MHLSWALLLPPLDLPLYPFPDLLSFLRDSLLSSRDLSVSRFPVGLFTLWDEFLLFLPTLPAMFMTLVISSDYQISVCSPHLSKGPKIFFPNHVLDTFTWVSENPFIFCMPQLSPWYLSLAHSSIRPSERTTASSLSTPVSLPGFLGSVISKACTYLCQSCGSP